MTDQAQKITDSIEALVARQEESEKNRLRLGRELTYTRSIRRPMSGDLRCDVADQTYNDGVDAKETELENAIQACVDEFNNLQVKIAAAKDVKALAEKTARVPSGDARKDTAHHKELVQAVKDAEKRASSEEIATAKEALQDWLWMCEGREIAVDYSPAAAALALPLKRWYRLLEGMPAHKRPLLDDVASFIEHPIRRVLCLPRVYIFPDVFVGSNEPGADGSKFFHYHPGAHD